MNDTVDTILVKAQKCHESKNFHKAERLYRQIIRRFPSHPIATNNLSAILIDRGSYSEAEQILTSTIAGHGGYADSLANLAACHGHFENWEECVSWCRKSISMNPGNPMPYLWLARAEMAISGQGKALEVLRDAISRADVYKKDSLISELILMVCQTRRRALALKEIKRYYISHTNKHLLLKEIHSFCERSGGTGAFFRLIRAASKQTGNNLEIDFWLAKHFILTKENENSALAVRLLLNVVKHIPQHSDAWIELGDMLIKKNNFTKGIACLHRAIKEDPRSLAARIKLVSTHIERLELREAVKQSAEMLIQFPEQTEALTTHCYALINGDKWQAALRLLERFKHMHPSKIDRNTINCEGVAYTKSGRFIKATEVFKSALRTYGQNATVWNNCGMAYGLAQKSRPEIYCYRRAVALLPEDPGSHMNLAMARMARGDYDRGLQEYEWRLKDKNGSLNGKVNGPLLEPGEHPESLIIMSEQGLGDTLQFARFLYDLRLMLPHSDLTFACPDKLLKLLKSSLCCVDDVVSCEAVSREDDASPYLPLMSLPYFCRIHPHESSAPSPYLQVGEHLIGKARAVMREGVSEEHPVIGINWRGNPVTERSNLKGRSMPLDALTELSVLVPDSMFVSLQKGAGSEELETCSFRDRFISNQAIISDDWCFISTSAYILACDFIITTDTSVAHLAGALGKKTYLLLAAKPEWRWCNDSRISRWYPSVTLVRQIASGDWRHPVRDAAAEIQDTWMGTKVA